MITSFLHMLYKCPNLSLSNNQINVLPFEDQLTSTSYSFIHQCFFIGWLNYTRLQIFGNSLLTNAFNRTNKWENFSWTNSIQHPKRANLYRCVCCWNFGNLKLENFVIKFISRFQTFMQNEPIFIILLTILWRAFT